MNEPVSGPPAPAVPDHELLRVIGRGSYGEVWLARDVLGEFRAVKLVRHLSSVEAGPSGREFDGLRKFEPVSRSHPGLVHILHAGRLDGGFFYVMELADPAKPGVGEQSSQSSVNSNQPAARGPVSLNTEHCSLNTASYVPRTLRSELQHRGRLPVAECVELALRLTDALAHLHGHGLVHRDIKPSNIIFVRGQPKLADIGLVASADTSMSCVGTEGYLPPEGPGKPPADLYALGKVLYELATGRDRTNFPELPTLLREDPERRALEEFNEVILKACEPETHRRYQSAKEMRADLLLMQSGKSVRQVRRRAKGWTRVRKFSLATGVVLAIVAGFRWLIPEVAQSAPFAPRRLAIEKAWDHFDVSPDGERIAFLPQEGILVWERKTSSTRRLTIRGAEGWLTPANRRAVGLPRWAPNGRHLAFMPAKQIGGTEDAPTNAYSMFLVDTQTGEARKLGADLSENERLQDWCWQPDGLGLTCVTQSRQFFTVLLTGKRIPWRESGLAASHFIEVGGYSPDGKWLAIALDQQVTNRREREIWLMPHLGGRAVRLTETLGRDSAPTWSPDGESIYFVSDDGNPLNPTRGIWRLRVNLRTGTREGTTQEVFTKKGQQLDRPKFVAGGRRLFYVVNEQETRIWVSDATDLTQTNSPTRGQDPVLSPDGETIYFTGETPEQQGVFAVDRHGRTLPRRLGNILPLVGGYPRGFLQLSPDGSLLALPGIDGRNFGVFLLPTTGEPARLVETITEDQSAYPAWSPDGQWLVYPLGQELRLVSRDLTKREVLATLASWDGSDVRWSPDGEHIAAFAYGNTNTVSDNPHLFVVSLVDRQVRQLTPDSEDKYKGGLEWHPDGHRLTYFYYGPEQFNTKLRWAYLNRPGQTEEMLNQDGRWDYTGSWAPDGRSFHFASFPNNREPLKIAILDADTKQENYALRNGYRPEWSNDGHTMVWAVDDTKRDFEEIENFLR